MLVWLGITHKLVIKVEIYPIIAAIYVYPHGITLISWPRPTLHFGQPHRRVLSCSVGRRYSQSDTADKAFSIQLVRIRSSVAYRAAFIAPYRLFQHGICCYGTVAISRAYNRCLVDGLCHTPHDNGGVVTETLYITSGGLLTPILIRMYRAEGIGQDHHSQGVTSREKML